jgi:undecaprenyl-diphosphatase
VSAVAEILPVSGTGHAALIELLLGTGLGPSGTWAMKAGVWLGTVVFFRREIVVLLAGGAAGLRDGSTRRGARGWRLARSVALGTVGALGVGLAIREQVAPWGADPLLVGAAMLLSAMAIASTLTLARGDRDAPTAWGACLVGAVQGAAMLPGLSRTGIALSCLMWLGVRGADAFELALVLTVPADLVFILTSSPGHAGLLWLTTVTAGVAAIVFLTLGVLRLAVARHLVPLFAVYLVPLAVATLAWSYARP